MKRRHAFCLARLLAAGLLVVGTARAGSAAPAAGPTGAEPLTLRRMVAACTVSMADNVCSVANGASAPAVGSTAPNRPPVFVVGAGAVDRDAYGYLQQGGKAMCARAQSACSADWAGKVCVTARSLWAD